MPITFAVRQGDAVGVGDVRAVSMYRANPYFRYVIGAPMGPKRNKQ